MTGNETVFEHPEFFLPTAGQRNNDSGNEINMTTTARVIYFAHTRVDIIRFGVSWGVKVDLWHFFANFSG